MAIYLTERDVEALLTTSEAISALEQAFRSQSEAAAINQPRQRIHMPDGTYHIMAAADLTLHTFGIKTYAAFRPKARFLFLLYSSDNGDLLAILEADRLGQIRTGAASGVAARFMAKQSADLLVGLYGSGWQAQSQLEAICTVRHVQSVTVYSRDAAKREAFCTTMSQRLGISVKPATRPEAAAEGQDIVITATSARDPVLCGDWLTPGAHVNAVGSNMLTKREIDETVVQRSGLIVVDSIKQAKRESGDLLPAFERRLFRWEQVRELHEIVSGRSKGRTDDAQISLFKSNGIALEDVAVATLVYRKALDRKFGTEIPMWQSNVTVTDV